MRLRVLAALTVLVALVLTGCSSTSGSPQPGTSQPAATPEVTPTEAEIPTEADIPTEGDIPSEADITAAAAGLDQYLTANRPETPRTSNHAPGCPAIELGVLEEALGEYGLNEPLQDWGVEIEWDEFEEVDPDLMGIACGGDTDGDSHDSDQGLQVSVVAIEVPDDLWDTFQQAGRLTDLPRTTHPDRPGEHLAECLGDSCISLWRTEQGLTLVLLVEGRHTLTREDMDTLLYDLAPEMLRTLSVA